jgi:hypothetical protein
MQIDQPDERTTSSKEPASLAQFFRESPLAGVDLDLERDMDTGRELEF